MITLETLGFKPKPNSVLAIVSRSREVNPAPDFADMTVLVPGTNSQIFDATNPPGITST
jgi:hypothetical protein